ncbi:hypothetical protein G9A89_018619 [Geosiphon pyriformis]|nr:hypothetical protein G9A89_018619 [Geosiphon pyriformis]
MENKEIKRTPPYAHDCNQCENCQESIQKNVDNVCSACQFKFFEKLYCDFSSGNKVVDEIIKNPLYNPPKNEDEYREFNGKVNNHEWIPWERLSNITEIARGGFGVIYKATLIDGLINKFTLKHHGEMEYKREGKDREVAIKIIKKNSEEVFKELNIQRAIFNKSWDTYSISLIYGITQSAETLEYGIVMEFAKHGDMRKYLSTNFHSTSWKDKLDIAWRILYGLYSIHSSGMVHRDLHSGNILQFKKKTVSIGDLGLCQPTNNEATTIDTTTGKVASSTTSNSGTEDDKKIYGVIPYIPPEVLKGKEFTMAGDMYSLAMLLWELATGKPPFHDRSHDHFLAIDILFNGARPEITSPLIPPFIAEIIEKCWNDNPLNRPTAKEVLYKLTDVQNIYDRFKWDSTDEKVSMIEQAKIKSPNIVQFLESDKFVKEMVNNDDSTINYLTTTTTTTTMTTNIHPGAVYTSRVLTLQMVDFSKELVYLPEDKAKSKKTAPDICPKISNKISIRGALSVVEATRQNVLEAFPLPSNREKLLLVATESTFSFLAGFLPVKVSSKKHIWTQHLVLLASPLQKKWSKRPKVQKITSSGMSSKMGQNQPLAVLPNVVFSGRLSLVLEAKQSPPVGSSVFGNWADQMETDLSSPLVFGATFGGVWETITSCQKFAGWVASTLVPGAIFKIKLAHIKTVFQSVHGFLGAKSVSKDNVKLFCVEFAFQQSLKAAFLVELTSSVCLATLKIAKSLVVFESGSSSATVALCDVPLGVSAADIKLALSVFGSVTRVVLKPAGIWQYVIVYFEKLDSAVSVLKHWSVLVGKDSIRIFPLVNQNETILFRDKFKTKLVNLSSGCTAFEISNMISQIGDQTCFIPCFPNSGCCSQFALVIFDSQGDLDSAVIKTGTLKKCHIWWETLGCRRCFRCQEMGHLAMDCKIFSSFTLKVPKIFKSRFVGSASYVKTTAPFGLSEFPPLVVSSATSAANPAVSSRLNSLEKQISDLAALVKSIVKPVGSLVALVSCLFDDNAIKAVQVEKDIISMKSAANNFSNLMVRVSKDIACLKSEVDFGDMDYDGVLAAKPSFLSEDTIEHVIALWQMSSAETRGNIESTRLFFSGFIFDSRNLNGIIERIRGLGLFLPTFDSA